MRSIQAVFGLITLFGLAGCDEIKDKLFPPKKPNVNVQIYHEEPTNKYKRGSVIRVNYPLGKLKIPADYYRTGDVNTEYALTKLYITWPEMVGYRRGGTHASDERVVSLYTTYEKEKGSHFKGEDYYLLLQQRLQDKRVAYIRPSQQFKGLTEYWSRPVRGKKEETKRRHIWQIFYLTDDARFTSTENNPLVIECLFFGIAPDVLAQEPSRKDCYMQWNIDASMSTQVQFNYVVMDDWQTMYHGVKAFINDIRME